MRRLATCTAAAALIVPSVASAHGPATMRGVVYSCRDRAPMASARVMLHLIGDVTDVRLVADRHGRFVRVGLPPGSYLVFAEGAASGDRYGGKTRLASRLATLEPDDVLDMEIGADPNVIIPSQRGAADLRVPHPLCDAALVPPAPPMTDRYIIH